MDHRFLVDSRGGLSPADTQHSPLAGRTGYYRLQPTSSDLLVLVRHPVQGGVADQKPRVAAAGDCDAFPLQDLMGFLGQGRWTGLLRVSGPTGERTLTIKDGEVRGAQSDFPGDRLGEVMVRLGYISRPQLEQILGEAPPSRVGKAMVERGLVKPHDLYRCLQEQIAEVFHAMMLTREGTFLLIDQDLDDKSHPHALSVSMQGLLMDSVRKIDELAQFRKKIPSSHFVVLPRSGPDEDLEEEARALLALVDGRMTLLQLAQAGKLSEFDATRIVHGLMQSGHVQLAAPTAVPSSSPSGEILITLDDGPPDERRILRVFNVIFREVRNEVAKHGNLEAFLASANAALRGSGVSTSRVLAGLSFAQDGALDEPAVLQQYHQLAAAGGLGTDPVAGFKQALLDVMFFLLFQSGELLESRADEDLARRVKALLASLDPRQG